MGTRSIIAVKDGEGWKGRYAHWDGYPSWMGVQLLSILHRDGYDAAVKNLVEQRAGWSSVRHDQDASEPLGIGYTGGRFEQVMGYGTGYTEKQASLDEWITHDGDDWGAGWAYVLDPEGITILKRRYTGPLGWEECGRVLLTNSPSEAADVLASFEQ